MKQRLTHLLLAQAIFFLCQFSLSAQDDIVIQQRQDSLVTFKLDSLDILYGLAGDTVASHPYYTFLWVFGDGSFINGTRDSVLSHIYERRNKRLYHLGGALSGAAEVTVYATGNYSGGTRPPRLVIPPPGDPNRYPTVMRKTFKLPALGAIDPTPMPIDTSVIDKTKTGALRLQLSNKVRPQDTLVSILSFRQPGKVPVQPIRGQVLLFYNSKVKQANRVETAVKKLFKNTSPPPSPPPALTHGKFNFQREMIHFTNVTRQANGDLAGQGITEFQNVIGFDFDSLSAEGLDERHLFVEFQNDSLMWSLFKNNMGDTLKFLAVMTALSSSTDILGQLPNVQSAYLEQIGIQNLLQTKFYTDGTFLDLGQTNQQSKIIGISEVVSPVVAAHDPNNLTVYACECPNPAEKKIAGVIDFSNDGKAETRQLSITLHVPDQLNLSSVESISLTPTPLVTVQPQIDLAARTVTWSWPALLYPAESAGYLHPSTTGQVVFTIALKDGVNLADVEPLTACIVFDQNDPMCTLPAKNSGFITSEDGSSQLLQCDECKKYPGEGAGIDWICVLLWALGIFLLILILWFLRRFFS